MDLMMVEERGRNNLKSGWQTLWMSTMTGFLGYSALFVLLQRSDEVFGSHTLSEDRSRTKSLPMVVGSLLEYCTRCGVPLLLGKSACDHCVRHPDSMGFVVLVVGALPAALKSSLADRNSLMKRRSWYYG